MIDFGSVLAAIGALIAIVIGAFFRGKSSGKTQEKQERTEQTNKQREQAQSTIKEVKHEVNQKSDDAVSDELKSKWVRK